MARGRRWFMIFHFSDFFFNAYIRFELFINVSLFSHVNLVVSWCRYLGSWVNHGVSISIGISILVVLSLGWHVGLGWDTVSITLVLHTRHVVVAHGWHHRGNLLHHRLWVARCCHIYLGLHIRHGSSWIHNHWCSTSYHQLVARIISVMVFLLRSNITLLNLVNIDKENLLVSQPGNLPLAAASTDN